MFQLSRAFSFESAHRLAKGYVGKCANIHGHSFRGTLTVACATLNHYGIGIDYADLKTFLKTIEAELDHALLLFEGDLPIISMCKETAIEFKSFSDNPTSEVLARYIYEAAQAYFSKTFPHVQIVEVAIEETCMSRCVYRG